MEQRKVAGKSDTTGSGWAPGKDEAEARWWVAIVPVPVGRHVWLSLSLITRGRATY